uniref:Anion exchange protein n=1 Tax=Parastrongyloides trichosuri TaxID=131310 RepID=A0A0N5A3S7_PARTI
MDSSDSSDISPLQSTVSDNTLAPKSDLKIQKKESAIKGKSSTCHPVQHVKFKLGAGDIENHHISDNEGICSDIDNNKDNKEHDASEHDQLLRDNGNDAIEPLVNNEVLENENDNYDHNHYYHNINPEVEEKEVLVELFDLKDPISEKKARFWEETARWLKYEEDAEEINDRWGQPHVPFLNFNSLIRLRRVMLKGEFNFDSTVTNFNELCNLLTNSIFTEELFKCEKEEALDKITEILSLDQKFVGRKPSRSNTQASSILSVNFSNSFSRLRSTSQIHSSIQPKYSFPSLKYHHANESATLIRRASTQLNENRSYPNISRIEEGDDNNEHFENKQKRRQSVFQIFSDKTSSTQLEKKNSFFNKYDDIFKHLPIDCEKVDVLCGCIPTMEKARFVMVRMKKSIHLEDYSESIVPLRFIFVILGPELQEGSYHELGRALSTLMADPRFRRIAYATYNKLDLVEALDSFLDSAIVIPPIVIDNKRLLWSSEIKKFINNKRTEMTMAERKGTINYVLNNTDNQKVHPTGQRVLTLPDNSPTENDEKKMKLFSLQGVKDDICGRFKYYKEDFVDALNLQCLSSIIFMFFACFAPAITFGGLMGNYTNGQMGVMETLLAQCICGVIWGFVSSQPLIIVSATGPVLVFEAALYTYCESNSLDFLSIRVYAGVFMSIISTISVGLGGARLLKYVTRFTEEIFATLISIIFFIESSKFIKSTFAKHPVKSFSYYMDRHQICGNVSTIQNVLKVPDVNAFRNYTAKGEDIVEHIKKICVDHTELEPNTALLTLMVTVGVFTISYAFAKVRSSRLFSFHGRKALADFGVLFSIVIVSVFVFIFFKDPYLKTLEMKHEFGYTNSTARGHGIIVIPKTTVDDLPFSLIVGFLVAWLNYILIFVETEITELLLDKKERGLKRGGGRNWDLLLISYQCLLMSFLGLPWMCAAAVQSLAHCSSLTIMKKALPGAKQEVDYVIENRITTIGVSLLIGSITLIGKYLRLPLACLFGIFIYLGVMNLSGIQLVQRIKLMFILQKNHPATSFTEQVRLRRMHYYTLIQIACLIFIILIKIYLSLLFPFILIIFILIRVFILPRIYTNSELNALDSDDGHEDDEWMEKDFYEHAPIPV